jgi:excinuclease UvrABC nuclease subunit
MPWNGSGTWNFELASILRHTPTASGVYVVLSLGRWLYVGESGSLRGGLALRCSGAHSRLAEHHPTHFMYELVADAERVARRRELIREFQPVCNR